ncbi:hypothetical protein PV11_10099 [Exophiala sideris]|uniref:MYND-type domain-containing protein n=1 Tax=Exophiala sideris TaxID=1016849 RepID=A0A0D1Y681_9EURO|nr:hypothetical protein PV11_10099 [Exophiala sideris]
MANPYPFRGDPQDVDLVAHDENSKDPIYMVDASSRVAMTMISPPSTAELFPPTDDEADEEKDTDAEDLIYQACDRNTIPTNPRAREVFGFNLCQSEQQANCLPGAYRIVKNKGIHEKILGSWRAKATLENHIGAIIGPQPSTDQLQFLVTVKPILRALDQAMQNSAMNWTQYERLLRSKMQEYPFCIKCGAKHGHADSSGQEPLQHCGRCKKVRYCSKECQTEDWNVHESACKAAAQADN